MEYSIKELLYFTHLTI